MNDLILRRNDSIAALIHHDAQFRFYVHEIASSVSLASFILGLCILIGVYMYVKDR